jgi:hypothetical protein
VWWRRWHDDSDQDLDNAHLMRLAGRFARRVRASAAAHGIPVIDVARVPATAWKVTGTPAGVIRNLEKTRQFVNRYSSHIMDPVWAYVTIKMSGHPPFGAPVILNGHEYVACTRRNHRVTAY